MLFCLDSDPAQPSMHQKLKEYMYMVPMSLSSMLNNSKVYYIFLLSGTIVCCFGMDSSRALQILNDISMIICGKTTKNGLNR